MTRATPPQTDDVAQAPGRIELRLFLLVGALTTFGPLCIDLYLPSLPAIGRDLNTGASNVQLSLTSCLIGMAAGQAVVGPISDRLGRRKPLFFGLGAFVIASAACALSPGIAAFVALRFLQGFGGAAGIVISRAIVRDLYSGAAAARFFSLLMLITGLSPLLAPQLGAGLLLLGPWRLQFLVLALLGGVLLALTAWRLPETLEKERRRPDGFRMTLRTMRMVLIDRTFLVYALACGLGYGALWAYVAGSAFVLEDIYGLSPQLFGITFAINGAGMVLASQLNSRLVNRFGSPRLLTVGLVGLASAGVGLLVLAVLGVHSLAAVLVCLFVLCSSNGFIAPNAMALAMNDFPEAAGTASALIGILQFSIGAVVAPVVGLGGNHNILPMAIVVAAFGVAAITVRLVLGRKITDKQGVAPNVHHENNEADENPIGPISGNPTAPLSGTT